MGKIHQLKCSNCGANLEVDEEQTLFRCTYCGAQLLFEADNKPSPAARAVARQELQAIQEWLTSIGVEVSLGQSTPPLVLKGKRVTDDDLSRLLPLTDLGFLDISSTAVTDRGMEVLASFKELTHLYLSKNTVGDEGIASLQGLTHLKHLDLGHTRITDLSLPLLARIPKLDTLSLEGTEVTAAGLIPLLPRAGKITIHSNNSRIRDADVLRHKVARLFPGNTTLNLIRGDLTDEDLPEMLHMPGLENLSLSGNSISDAGLSTVGRMKFLVNLWLDGNPISDAGLSHLWGLDRLRTLDLRGTKVTGKGIGELKKRLPDVSF